MSLQTPFSFQPREIRQEQIRVSDRSFVRSFFVDVGHVTDGEQMRVALDLQVLVHLNFSVFSEHVTKVLLHKVCVADGPSADEHLIGLQQLVAISQHRLFGVQRDHFRRAFVETQLHAFFNEKTGGKEGIRRWL